MTKRIRYRNLPTFTTETRKWIYGIFTAALVLASGYFGIDAATQQNWTQLAAAILNLATAGATDLARRNVS